MNKSVDGRLYDDRLLMRLYTIDKMGYNFDGIEPDFFGLLDVNERMHSG